MEVRTLLEPAKYYHIYNRGIAGADIFPEDRNYAYFLKLYARHVAPAVSTLAYCLLRNHFHLFIQIKTSEVALASVEAEEKDGARNSSTASLALANFFNAYAKAINHAYARNGALFEHRFRRVEVAEELYGLRLIHYIHHNPQKHGFVEDYRHYSHSSYRAFLSDRPTGLQRQQVLEWFGGRERFVAVHQTLTDEKALREVIQLGE
jgi:REP element-mobilizing transposase RayT